MAATDDSSWARLPRERAQVESAPPSTIKSLSNNRGSSGNGNFGGRRNADSLPTTGKLLKDRNQSYSSTKRSEAPSPDSAGFEKIEKHELDGHNLPTNDGTVLPPPVIDSQAGQRPLETQNPEGQSSRSQAATSGSKPVGSRTTVKSPLDPIPRSASSEDKRQDRQIPHDAAPSNIDHRDRGNGSRTDINQAHKGHQIASYSDKLKGPPDGAPPERPTNDNGSSSLSLRTPAEGPPSTQVGSSHHASQMTDAHNLETHIDNRGGANLVRRPSNHSPPSRYNIGGIATGISNLLGGRGPLMEIPRDEYRHLQKDAKELRLVRREFDSRSYQLQRVIGECRTQARSLQVIQQENQGLRERVDSLEHELKSVSRKYEEVKSLSDTRGKELVGAQVFLSKADSLSISDLSHKINTLNQEIYQAAASLGDSIVRRHKKISEEESKQVWDHAKALLGSGLAQILHAASQNSEEPVNVLLVQVIIQALLVNFCAKKIIQWTQDDSANDHFLQALYHEIRSSSEQAVSGRWRALTRGQLKPESDSWRIESIGELQKILKAASWEVHSPDDVQSFEAKLEAIFKVVLDARMALGEKVTSADIEVSIVDPGSPFSEAFMEDEYAADRQEGLPSPPTVVATTGMGLWKVTAPASPNDAAGTSTYTNVLSPKVVLESTLIAVLEPPPPVPKPKRPSKASARLDEKSK